MKRFLVGIVLCLAAIGKACAQQDVSISILGLFHAKILTLEAERHSVVVVYAGGREFVLNGEPEHRSLDLQGGSGRISLNGLSVTDVVAKGRDGGAADFVLSVPRKLRRTYHGTLQIHAAQEELTPILHVDLELAVASIVAAEMGDAPLEALKAQAVVTRSFLSSGAKHHDFDFCDTTHCQFFCSPPLGNGKVWQAVRETRGLVLLYEGKVLAALYSSRCGGRTHSLQEVGLAAAGGYPYFGIRCDSCRKKSETWKTYVGKEEQLPSPGNELHRLQKARQWGWSALPGSDFHIKPNADGWTIEGKSVGHAIGLCQYGAQSLANQGLGFREILSRYFPNTHVASREQE